MDVRIDERRKNVQIEQRSFRANWSESYLTDPHCASKCEFYRPRILIRNEVSCLSKKAAPNCENLLMKITEASQPPFHPHEAFPLCLHLLKPLVPISNLRDIHAVGLALALPHNLCNNVSVRIEMLWESRVRTSVRCGHGYRDSSAHSHDGEGKEGDDVLGVHLGER